MILKLAIRWLWAIYIIVTMPIWFPVIIFVRTYFSKTDVKRIFQLDDD